MSSLRIRRLLFPLSPPPPPLPLPPLAELLSRAYLVRLPLRFRFRGLEHREAVIIRGERRWCEFSPFWGYGPELACRWLAAAVSYGWGELPRPAAAEVPVNATIPELQPSEVAAGRLAEVISFFPGCTAFKVKVGDDQQANQLLLAELRRELREQNCGEGFSIRLDANRAWSPARALEHILGLLEGAGSPGGASDISYVEQPCASLGELALLRRRLRERGVPVRVAADESVRLAADLRREPDPQELWEAADLLVVKVQPLGGPERLLSLLWRLRPPEPGAVVFSSALETSVGLGMGLRTAACLPGRLPAGLGTAALLAADVVEQPLLPRNGIIPMSEVLALRVDEEVLYRYRGSVESRARWEQRIRDCYRLLQLRNQLLASGSRRPSGF